MSNNWRATFDDEYTCVSNQMMFTDNLQIYLYEVVAFCNNSPPIHSFQYMICMKPQLQEVTVSLMANKSSDDCNHVRSAHILLKSWCSPTICTVVTSCVKPMQQLETHKVTGVCVAALLDAWEACFSTQVSKLRLTSHSAHCWWYDGRIFRPSARQIPGWSCQ